MKISRKQVALALLFSLINFLYPPSTSNKVPEATAKETPLYNNSDFSEKNRSVSVLFTLPEIKDKKPRQTLWLTMTAYSSTPDQTDSSPFITASGERVRDGIVAYNHLPFGTQVRFPEVFGDKIFVVKDRLRAGAGIYIVDRWVESRAEAINWGARVLKMEVL